MRAALVSLVALFLAAPALAQPEPTPVWRMDLSHLEADVALIQSCLVGGGRGDCAGVVQEACGRGVADEIATTTAHVRRCGWRGIAAWEDELARARTTLRGFLSNDEMEREASAQAAWEAFMLANVRFQVQRFEGGSLSPVLAGEVRVRMLAARTLEVQDLAAERAQD